MKLKRIELYGFKSFAERTVISLSDGITSIVGPNGSGKSNISDCLAWVMGEQSVRNLRGGTMQDVIFAGTAKRNPLSYASVSIVIDNAGGEFDLPYEEVIITRKLYRSGESEYLINDSACRLKDIHELLMDTGLGRDGYSIIGQGKIAEILSNKPDDRRQIFEEAAGISKFRYRREETIRKLGHTEDNLVRIDDILCEIQMQIEPLRQNSEKAKKYLALRDRLKNFEISHALYALELLRDNQGSDEGALALARKNEQDVIDKIANINELIASYYDKIAASDEAAAEQVAELKRVQEELADMTTKIGVEQAHIDNSYENKRALRDEIADIGRRIETADKGQENSVSFLDTKIKILENEIETGERDLAEKDGEIGKVRRELEALNFTISDMEREFYQSESRMRVLSDMQKDFDGYGVGVRHIMKSGVNGIIGTVGQLFTASDEYAPAVEVALGGAVANIVVENESIAKWAIRELKERKLGRATFLPLNSTYGNKLTGVPCEPGVLGVLSDFVQYQPEFHDIAVNLLGRTVLVDNIDNATYFSRGLGSKYRIVTLTGEIFAPGGAITGGSRGNNSGIFMRASELEALRKTMASLEAKVTLERTSRDKLAAELSEQQESLDALREDLANSKSEITLLNHKKMLLNDQIKLLEEELSRKQEVFDKFELTLKGHENAIVKLEALRVATVDKLGEIDVSCGKTSEERKKFEESIRALQDEQQGLSAAQLDLQKETTRLQGKHERAEVEKDAILLHIWEEYELTLSEMQAINEQVTTNNFGGFAPQIYFIKKLNLKEFRKKFNNSCSLFVVRCSLKDFKPQISKLKSQLKEIGNVDIEAIEKYREVSERAAFMETEREDLVASKANLEIIIEDITAQMREQFMEQFKLINAEFKVVFAKLFGGGEARLEIANNDDILESGIEITVQPPGKNVQNMMLLSGGEKALTAISLLLAIMRVRPAPFCVLDEIDAALDDINVTRFAEYLAEYAATTQFIMITHKRGTMEVSNLLYGVTMQERGVSTTIALDLDQVTVKEKDAENWTISFKTKVNTDATA